MDIYDRLEVCEMYLKRFELRTKNEDFNSLLFVANDVINILGEDIRFNHRREMLQRGIKRAVIYIGTKSQDKETIRAFDFQKRVLLKSIQAVKRQINDIDDYSPLSP